MFCVSFCAVSCLCFSISSSDSPVEPLLALPSACCCVPALCHCPALQRATRRRARTRVSLSWRAMRSSRSTTGLSHCGSLMPDRFRVLAAPPGLPLLHAPQSSVRCFVVYLVCADCVIFCSVAHRKFGAGGNNLVVSDRSAI